MKMGDQVLHGCRVEGWMTGKCLKSSSSKRMVSNFAFMVMLHQSFFLPLITFFSQESSYAYTIYQPVPVKGPTLDWHSYAVTYLCYLCSYINKSRTVVVQLILLTKVILPQQWEAPHCWYNQVTFSMPSREGPYYLRALQGSHAIKANYLDFTSGWALPVSHPMWDSEAGSRAFISHLLPVVIFNKLVQNLTHIWYLEYNNKNVRAFPHSKVHMLRCVITQ